MTMPTITLHPLEHSQSFRILWLMEEIGMDYTLRIYPRTSDLRAPPKYKAMSPIGVSPRLPMVIWRSVKATLSLNTFSARLTETVSMPNRCVLLQVRQNATITSFGSTLLRAPSS
jgi:hypothetical protein